MAKYKLTGGDIYAIFLKVLSIYMLIKATGYGNSPSFYSGLRVMVFLTSAYAIYSCLSRFSLKKMSWVVLFSGIALLFNPFFPIYLRNKSIWRIIDLNTAFFMFASIPGLDVEINGKPLTKGIFINPFEDEPEENREKKKK